MRLPEGIEDAMVAKPLQPLMGAATWAALALVATATPAHAETGSAMGANDEEFTQLFAEWQRHDGEASQAVAAAPAVAVPNGMPVEGVALTSAYGMRDHPVLRRRANHKGVDLAGPTGTPIYATADGIVSKAQRFGSYGNYVQIEHGGEMQTRYAHMSRIAIGDGARVKKGQLIGYIGSTGRSTGPHLHYEIRVAGRAVDPTPYMTQAAPERLARAEGGAIGGAD